MNRTGIAIIALSAFGLLGCHLLKKKNDKVLWSCAGLKPLELTSLSGMRVCTDVYASWKTCNINEKKSDQPCKQDGAVAGCRHKDGDYIDWYYTADRGYASVEDVGKYCEPLVTVLPNDAGVATIKSNDQRTAEELKKYLDESGPKAKATLATVATIAAKLPAPTGKVDLQGLKGDVILVHKEDLGNLESPKKIDYRIVEAGKLAACSRLLNGRKLPSDEAYELSNCAKNPFIGVLSVTSYNPPDATGSSVSGNTKTTYVKSGRIDGDLLFFRSDNGKYLGSVSIGTSNSSSDVTSPQIMTERLLESFPGAVHSQMKKAAPNVTNSSFTFKKN